MSVARDLQVERLEAEVQVKCKMLRDVIREGADGELIVSIMDEIVTLYKMIVEIKDEQIAVMCKSSLAIAQIHDGALASDLEDDFGAD
ncbi:hypothetical protein LTR37_019785 [Vermiconidia calcicola]|uniref:Uncharacterized protein n=1 Tax=Vermiconidia calcicola TaxID=1690605 RepID=A0ACC3MEB0_9PEZI|nr:hypothetical protein LTR37_019785 [Vermiconidia calcicola]